jgi:hypothetical protein
MSTISRRSLINISLLCINDQEIFRYDVEKQRTFKTGVIEESGLSITFVGGTVADVLMISQAYPPHLDTIIA